MLNIFLLSLAICINLFSLENICLDPLPFVNRVVFVCLYAIKLYESLIYLGLLLLFSQ